MEARNRRLPVWFNRISSRQLTLPRFQRMIAWDHRSVAELLTTVLRGLPAGAALILEVGDEEKFVSRTMQDAPCDGERVTEQLLDGQQRLTALWRSLYDKYPDRTFLVGFEEDPNEEGTERPYVYGQSRWQRNGKTYPLWVDDPEGCWERRFLPVYLLQPDDNRQEVRRWAGKAVGKGNFAERDKLMDIIDQLRQHVREFNLPYLALPVNTPTEVALDVFVKMNTSSVKLSTYDIVVALVEEAAGESLHALVDQINTAVPRAEAYADLPSLALDVSALLQDRIPSNAGYKGLDFHKMLEKWDDLITGIGGMVRFLEEEKIFDRERLPSYSPLPIVAALWTMLPRSPDALGNARHLLRQYLWRAFLTERYEQSSTSNALQDFRALRRTLQEQATVDEIPIFNEESYPPPPAEEIALAEWPRRRTILGRGLLALQLCKGALDIADGSPATVASVKEREYHHLFPDSLLETANVPRNERSRSVNCVLISWRTNRTISNKDPVRYLKERADNNALGEDALRYRLRTHLVPYGPLAVGVQGDLSEEAVRQQVRADYAAFIDARSAILAQAAACAMRGLPLTDDAIFTIEEEL